MMENLMPEKDSQQVQKDRITTLVSEDDAGLRVEFYKNRMDPMTSEIRFRLVDAAGGDDKILGSIPQDYEWASSEVADKSDGELLRRILATIRR
jgi:hypothetical protein